MSRRKFRLTAPKNWERKYAKPEALHVSIPLCLLPPTVTMEELHALPLPSMWSFIPTDQESTLRLCKMEQSSIDNPMKVFVTIEMIASMEWNMFIYSNKLEPQSNPVLSSLPNPVKRCDDLLSIVNCVDSSSICAGNDDEAFAPLIDHHKGDFKDAKGQ